MAKGFDAKTEIANHKGVSDEWGEPDMALVNDVTVNPPPFPVKLLGAAGEWAVDAAQGVRAPVDYVVASVLASVSAILANCYRVALTPTYLQPPVLWCMLIGDPSTAKTPACVPVMAVMSDLETRIRLQHEARLDVHIQELKGKLSPKPPKEEAPGLEDDLKRLKKDRGKPPRLYVQDSTVEALADVELRSPRGLLVYGDEMGSLVNNLDKYGGSGNRGRYLEGWNGGSSNVERKSEGSSSVPNHSLAILGGIQPDPLRDIFLDGVSDDGFMARALLFWPNRLEEYVRPKAFQKAPLEKSMERLLAIEFSAEDGPTPIGLSDSALNVYDKWAAKDHKLVAQVKGRLASAYGKFAGQVLRLAFVLAFLDWAWSDKEKRPGWLDHDVVDRATQLIEEYFRPQANRVYRGCDRSPEESVARALLLIARKRELTEFLEREAEREWSLPLGASRHRKRNMEAAITLLVDAGWIRKAPEEKGPGRPPKCWEINPALFDNN